ncbi:glycosyltransferase family 2 protein [Streptomyces cacaoi]
MNGNTPDTRRPGTEPEYVTLRAARRTAGESRIDVICPTHNRSTRIRPTLDSVLAQSVGDWRLVVVSDGSTDDTEDVVRAYDDPRIALLRCPPHGHPGGPRNIGLHHAGAPFAAYIDHDDTWRPDHLAVLLEMLESGAQAAATGCRRLTPEGGVEDVGAVDMVWHPEIQALAGLNEPSRVGHVRELVPRVGGWTQADHGFEDWDLWWRMAEQGIRFTTDARRTVQMRQTHGTRRETITAKYAITVARTSTREVAEAVVERLREPWTARRMRDGARADLAAWHTRLAATPDYVVPRGHTVAALRDACLERVARMENQHGYQSVFTGPKGDGWALFLTLWCTQPAHASRVSGLLARRDVRQRAVLAELVEECERHAGRGSGHRVGS